MAHALEVNNQPEEPKDQTTDTEIQSDIPLAHMNDAGVEEAEEAIEDPPDS